MGKIIIENRSSVSDNVAISLVQRVITKGRVSNDGKQYCYATVFRNPEQDGEIAVYTDLNKKSDRFVVSNG